MTRTQRLAPVIQHTDDKKQQALRAVAISQKRVDDEIQRLAQLTSYKSEYLSNGNSNNIVYSVIELVELNRFLAQLDNTILRQREVINLRQKELDHKRDAWKTTLVNSNVIHKVVENLQAQEMLEENRTEQKDQDDLSQRKLLK